MERVESASALLQIKNAANSRLFVSAMEPTTSTGALFGENRAQFGSPSHILLIKRCDPIRSVQTRVRSFNFTLPVPKVIRSGVS
jgi:hypothetical protein